MFPAVHISDSNTDILIFSHYEADTWKPKCSINGNKLA